MALIKCPDCGKDVSEYAEKCVHCGANMTIKNIIKGSAIKKIDVAKNFISNNKRILKIAISTLLVIIAVFVVYCILYSNSALHKARTQAEMDRANYEYYSRQYEELYGDDKVDIEIVLTH